MTPVFLDSGFLIALEAADDQHHPEALAYWRLFQESPAQLVTTTYVLDEVATFFNRYGHHAKAVEIGQHVGRNSAAYCAGCYPGTETILIRRNTAFGLFRPTCAIVTSVIR